MDEPGAVFEHLGYMFLCRHRQAVTLNTQSYQDSKKLVPSKTFQQAVDDNGKNINNELEIINRPGTQNAPQGMSIDDVKRLLGN